MMTAARSPSAPPCPRCRTALSPGVAVCPRCGQLAAAVPAAVRHGDRRRLLLLIGLGAVLAVAVRLWLSPGPSGDGCRGGERVSVEWQASEGTPRVESRYLTQIDPQLTPHVRRAVLRHSGNAVYADKCAHEYGHNHQAAVDEGHKAGGNAFFHAPAKALGAGEFEVSTTVVVAHPGPVARAQRDRYFPRDLTLQVVRVLPGGAADRGGLAVNDLIVAVDGQPAPPDADSLTRLGRGVKAGGQLSFEVLRGGVPQIVTMTREGDKIFGYWAIETPILELK
jgi:hypothetical protein